jgi:hypothetical protein
MTDSTQIRGESAISHRLAMMALHWFIDSRKRLVTVTAEGPVSRADIDGLLDAVTGAKALTYRKLVDVTAGRYALGPLDLLAIGARVRSLHAGSVGAVALVLPGGLPREDEPEDTPILVARLIGILASAKRPLRMFKSVTTARRWLDGPTVPAA